MSLADSLDDKGGDYGDGKKAPVAAVAIKLPKVDSKAFSDRAFKAAHSNDPEGFYEAMKGFIHACMDEYENEEGDSEAKG